MSVKEVTSPIDLKDMNDAAEWARKAMEKRPERPIFFDQFAQQMAEHAEIDRVLELGSGPGFLAEHLLSEFPSLEYVALDFSGAMHQLAKERLGNRKDMVYFVERDFKQPNWFEGLGKFRCIVTNQAVHELRHKSYAPTLHAQVRNLLEPDGLYLVNDHFAGKEGMPNDQLYMSREEQRQALIDAGFSEVTELLCLSKMCMLRARG